jgi:hypothetical protein
LLPGAIVGILLSTLFFSVFRDNDRALRMGVGILSLLFLAYQAGRSLLMGALEPRRPSRPKGIAQGVASRFTTMLAHPGGPTASI